jgi:flagellar basal-body rod modification protein FlgD
MISTVANTINSSASSSATTDLATQTTTLGKDDFLKMLVSQLKNQDPLNPMDGTQFSSQLAQFSTLEQMVQMNQNFTTQEQSNALTMEASLGASMIGKAVTATGNQTVVGEDGSVSVPVNVGGNADKVTVEIQDSNGKTVATRDFANVASGDQTFNWEAGLPAGVYTVQVTAQDTGGQSIPVTTYVHGVVDGVFFNQGQVYLRSGGLEIALDSLVEVQSPTGSTTG